MEKHKCLTYATRVYSAYEGLYKHYVHSIPVHKIIFVCMYVHTVLKVSNSLSSHSQERVGISLV